MENFNKAQAKKNADKVVMAIVLGVIGLSVLKVLGVLDISWYWVFAPLWLTIILGIILLVFGWLTYLLMK